MERLSELEKWRIAELAAQGLPLRLIAREIGRAHSAVASNLRVMLRPPVPERKRSELPPVLRTGGLSCDHAALAVSKSMGLSMLQ